MNTCLKQFIEILKLKDDGDNLTFYVANIGNIAPVEYFDGMNSNKAYSIMVDGVKLVTFQQKTDVYHLIIHDFVKMVKELLKEWE